MINNRFILIGHSIAHSKLMEHVHHEIQEVLAGSPFHNCAKEGEGMGGVQKSGVCM